MNTLPRAIFAALLALPFFAAASEAQPRASFEVARLGVEVETPAPDGRAGGPEQNCRVTIRGRHGGTSGRIGMKFSDSGVRTRAGYWVSLANSDGVDLMPGGTFSEVVDLDFACNARRRYRFALAAADGGGPVHRYDHYYPSENDFTQETTIDLGALCRFFEWCELAPEPDPDEPFVETPPDYDPTLVTLDGVPLDGEWTRSESTYDPNDGLRIRVQGNRANILTAPPSAHRTFEPGAAIWRSIQSDGFYRVLGSDGNYYAARLTPEGGDRLNVDVEHNGLGNDQTWVRAEDTTAGPATVSSCTWSPTAGDVRTQTSASLPSTLRNVLRDVESAGAPIQTLALTPDDEWVVVAGNVPCYSAGFPTGVRDHVDRFIASGREIDVVAFGSDGDWLILAEDLMGRSGVPDPVAEQLRQHLAAGRRVRALAFAPAVSSASDGIVFVTDGGEVVTAGALPRAFTEAVEAAETGQRVVHDVAFGGDGRWALVAGDWFVTDGAPLALLQDLRRYRTDEGRRIDRVVLDPRRGGNRWAIVSNAPEPAPTADADRMECELGPDDESIWARMKAHDVRGLAVAVVENNRIAWARGYGSAGPVGSPGGTVDIQRYVYPTTIFDAASISKPVAAVGALQLMDAGRLSLTRGGVLQDLVGPVVPGVAGPLITSLDPRREVNLARLLSHCAGLDHGHGGSGADARDPDQREPSIRNVILGLPPAGRRYRVVRTFTASDSTHYSGANYALVQGLIEAHAVGGFDTHMRRLFDALDMNDSAFRPPANPAERYAYGRNDECGAASTCPVQAYPNKAAAGLTTTVLDLARFVIMLNQGGWYDDPDEPVLQEATVRRMLKLDAAVGSTLAERQCTALGTMGLGMRVGGRGSTNERFWHRGTHNGFRTYIDGYSRRGVGLVLLMTAEPDDATAFRNELWSRFRAVYP